MTFAFVDGLLWQMNCRMVDVDVFRLVSFGFLAGIVEQIIIVSHIC